MQVASVFIMHLQACLKTMFWAQTGSAALARAYVGGKGVTLDIQQPSDSLLQIN